MEQIIVPVIFGVVIVAIVVLVLVCSSAARKKRSTCKKCKTRLNYENDISWTVTEEYITTDNRRKIAKVDFETVCSKCGYSKRFMKEYTIARIDNNGNLREFNLKALIRKDFL